MNTNYSYSSNKAQSLSDKAVVLARTKIYRALSLKIPLDRLNSVIDVGVTADREYASSNFFEKLFPYPERITALSDQDASWMTETGIKFVKGNALDMPFEDGTFDLVFSSAVIEHVGSRANQLQFLKECVRISNKYIFITTPNRWYPMELHTALPFLHWFPANTYRAVLRKIGKEFYSLESNLNLLSANDLKHMMENSACSNFEIGFMRFAGFKSNLLLSIIK
jgi:SAM-dependent methyltransferase